MGGIVVEKPGMMDHVPRNKMRIIMLEELEDDYEEQLSHALEVQRISLLGLGARIDFLGDSVAKELWNQVYSTNEELSELLILEIKSPDTIVKDAEDIEFLNQMYALPSDVESLNIILNEAG
jgi:hypothetical protein